MPSPPVPNGFPKPGDTCPSCASDFEPEDRMLLRPVGSTENKKMLVAACEHCDGERLFEVYEQTIKRSQRNDLDDADYYGS